MSVQAANEAFEVIGGSDEVKRAELAAAVQLGWRVSELYARADDPGRPVTEADTMLPSHGCLPPDDQLELQLHAAAGDARRAGIRIGDELLANLARCARRASSSPEQTARFRRAVSDYHIELSKALWARHEAAGKAYDLGNGLSDTYGRVRRAYRTESEDSKQAWLAVFDGKRVERLKKLLDDLESRLDSAGVAVVRQHLDVWCRRVADWKQAGGALPTDEAVREKLRRQTVIWRQLVAGDKSPEAYLNSDARAELKGDLRLLMWRRARRFVIPAAALLLVVVLFLPELIDLYRDRDQLGTGVFSVLVAIAGALGITKASMLATLRTQAQRWSELLWNRAVVAKVSERTLIVEELLPAAAARTEEHGAGAAALHAALRRIQTPLRRWRPA